MNLTEKELRELDAWIAERVFGKPQIWDASNQEFFQTENCKTWNPTPFFTTDPAAALKVFEKCLARRFHIVVLDQTLSTVKKICLKSGSEFEGEQAETLELAICLFSKKLFTK